MHTKSIFLTALFLLTVTVTIQARVWRVNNIPGVNADFDNLNGAVLSTSVLAGDTIYVEGSPIVYG
ncbi:MAG: hypothetical protein EOP54_29880, partial [Sphingobacteriales bacterium]